MFYISLTIIYPLLCQKKKSALFEIAEVVPVMTNNYEENILRGVQDSSYSLESSIELLQKDVVQLHAPRYQSMRRVSQPCHAMSTPFPPSVCLHPSLMAKSALGCMVNTYLRLARFCILVPGCHWLHSGDGLHPLAAQRYREDCLSPVLQMEGG